ncbi:MAG TPA: LLM class flavin-dependent oxidoreductase [Planctomycetaceae bacterium]|nr:LLM class flavin-dependent oxidoreductase [Planctomycetaceae bacterium]
MTTGVSQHDFEKLNRGYNHVFAVGELSIGLVVPIENYASGPVPTMERHIERVQLAERLGFRAVWIRDVPFNVPSFRDAGQTFDPFVYLGLLAAKTESITLGTASIILTLRHPAHVAKAAATADVLSGGRIILGVASGDRPDEFPAHNVPYDDRGQRFRDSFEYIRKMGDSWPRFENAFGQTHGQMDMLTKPREGQVPMLITGGSQQNPDWLADNGDGWMLYPRPAVQQASVIQDWRERIRSVGRANQPILEPLYIDLTENPDTPASPIHLGYRLGVKSLIEYLKVRRSIGVNHVALNLRFNHTDIEGALQRIAESVLPEFSTVDTQES